jgi:hypothetical protein
MLFGVTPADTGGAAAVVSVSALRGKTFELQNIMGKYLLAVWECYKIEMISCGSSRVKSTLSRASNDFARLLHRYPENNVAWFEKVLS